jgi:hypothetical protein
MLHSQCIETFPFLVFLFSYTERAGPSGGMGGMDMSALAGMMGGKDYV